MCFWAVAQGRWIWVEIPQRGQHSHLLNELSLSETCQSVLQLNSNLPPDFRQRQKPFPELCTPVVFQSSAIPWFDKESSQYLVVQNIQNTFILPLKHSIISGFQQTKSWPKECVKQLRLVILRQRCNSSKIHFTSSKALMQNSVCLNLQLMDLDRAGRNPLFYWL